MFLIFILWIPKDIICYFIFIISYNLLSSFLSFFIFILIYFIISLSILVGCKRRYRYLFGGSILISNILIVMCKVELRLILIASSLFLIWFGLLASSLFLTEKFRSFISLGLWTKQSFLLELLKEFSRWFLLNIDLVIFFSFYFNFMNYLCSNILVYFTFFNHWCFLRWDIIACSHIKYLRSVPYLVIHVCIALSIFR